MENDIIQKFNNYKMILSAIGEQYLCIFGFDIEEGLAFDVKNDTSYKLPEKSSALQKVIYSKIEEFTALENIPKLKHFTNLSSLEERMGPKKLISKIFLGKDRKWCNTKFIRIGDEKPLRYVLCIIERVDNQILFFERKQKELIENKKLHSMMNAFLEEYNTVCTVNLDNKRVEFSQLSERLVGSYLSASKMGNADEIAAMYIKMAIHEHDREELKKILTKEYVIDNIDVGNSATFEYRNELGNYFEMRIYRNSHNSIFMGFKDKSLEMKEMYNKIYTDSLTGVKNRKYYDEQIAKECCDAVIICDIDYFKSFNDTYGHKFGDRVITTAAQTLKHCLRASDEVIRYGGDEFVITFKEITIEALKSIIEKMRVAVSSITFAEQPDIHLSMSFGAAYGRGVAEAMLSKADDALYESKENRNCITITPYEKGMVFTKVPKNN